MKERTYEVAIVGAGPAGLAAAAAAKSKGAEGVIIVERDEYPGGILQQCIHPGFGLEYFQEELTGPEYAERFIDMAREKEIDVLLGTTALTLDGETLTCVNAEGLLKIRAGATILAMGCRERTRANLVIPGSRPAGIYTAGTAQRLLNVQGHMAGREIVILGSGDIGMIMARRLTLEGARVKAVVEIMPYLAGLIRNKVQCLDDFGIPLMLSHTITDITGIDRVESVTVVPVDECRHPVPGESQMIQCDTLLLSVGLIPENELSRAAGVPLSLITRGPVVNQYMQTEVPGIFACGNVLHVNDLADNVSRESELAGAYAALYARGKLPAGEEIPVVPGENIRYVCPQKIDKTGGEDLRLFFRVQEPRKQVIITAECNGKELYRRKTLGVSPGEMESVLIDHKQLELLSGSLFVHVRAAEVK